MDSRRASYFLAVIDAGSFSAAARSLHLSQPSLSMAVRELEQALGTPLLERLGRGIAVTPAGRALELHARRAMAEFAAGVAAVDDVLGLGGGSLTLCCLPTLATDPLAAAVGTFRRRHPDVKVSILGPEDTGEIEDMVRGGRADIGLTSATSLPGDLIGIPAARQALMAIFPPGSSIPAPFSIEDLISWDLVAFPPGASTRTILDVSLDEVGAQPRIAVEVAARDAVIPLVLAGAGAALVPEHMAHLAAARGAIVGDLTPPISRPVSLVHRPGPLSPAAARIVDIILERPVEGDQDR